jgi:VIT1/CCC1 family predicted Fe2+/Mn2+ transporter
VPGRAAIVTDWAESSAHRTEARIEAEREGVTMGLYLAIVTLAEASALDSSGVGAGATVAAIWGTAIGLALAHVFAFDLSARIFARGRPHRSTRLSATAQVIAAAAVAALATLPFLVFSRDVAFTISGLLMAALIGFTGFLAARAGGHGHGRALVVAVVTLVLGALVVAVKAGLGH